MSEAEKILKDFYNLNEDDKNLVLNKILKYNKDTNLSKIMDETIDENLYALKRLSE